jgi:hypothetical protein
MYVLCMCAVLVVRAVYLHAGVQRAPFQAMTQHLAVCAPVPEDMLSFRAYLPLLRCQAENLNDDEATEDVSA